MAKNTNSWRLNNTLLNNKEVTEEIRKEIKRFLETNDNENTRNQNPWDSAKAVLYANKTDNLEEMDRYLETWRRAWQPPPVFLFGESQGQRSLAGYSPWLQRVRHD